MSLVREAVVEAYFLPSVARMANGFDVAAGSEGATIPGAVGAGAAVRFVTAIVVVGGELDFEVPLGIRCLWWWWRGVGGSGVGVTGGGA